MSTFDERARTWDTEERRERAEAVAAAVRLAVPLDRRMRAIDVGAGTGLLGLALANDVGEILLAEPSAGMLEVLAEKLVDGAQPNASGLQFDLLSGGMPPGGPFDLAVSLLVLHHLLDTRAALAAIGGLLRSGGQIALADLDAEDGSFHDADAEGIHHLGFDREALAAMARDAGFVDVRFETAMTIVRDDGNFPVFLLLARRP